MPHYQPSRAKPGIRIWNSSNDWAQSGRRESGAPEVPRCQVDARKALPGRHPRTSIPAPKMPSLPLLPGCESPPIPPVVPLTRGLVNSDDYYSPVVPIKNHQ